MTVPDSGGQIRGALCAWTLTLRVLVVVVLFFAIFQITSGIGWNRVDHFLKLSWPDRIFAPDKLIPRCTAWAKHGSCRNQTINKLIFCEIVCLMGSVLFALGGGLKCDAPWSTRPRPETQTHQGGLLSNLRAKPRSLPQKEEGQGCAVCDWVGSARGNWQYTWY